MIFGRTDLQTDVPGGKFDTDFEVQSASAPPNPHNDLEKLIFRSEHFDVWFLLQVEEGNVENCLQRVFTKFRAG